MMVVLDLKVDGNASLDLTITDADATDATTQNGSTGTSIAAAFGFAASASVDLSSPADGDYVDAGETAVTWTDGAGCGQTLILFRSSTKPPPPMLTTQNW